jgi:hypothetical protein
MFRNPGELFVPEASALTSFDPDDTKFLQCAEAAQADYIITATSSISRLALMAHHERWGASGPDRIRDLTASARGTRDTAHAFLNDEPLTTFSGGGFG